MITREKIEIYKKYFGDIDAYARIGTESEKVILNDNEWVLIQSIIDDVKMVDKNLVSIEMKNNIIEMIKRNISDEEVIKEIKIIVKKGY